MEKIRLLVRVLRWSQSKGIGLSEPVSASGSYPAFRSRCTLRWRMAKRFGELELLEQCLGEVGELGWLSPSGKSPWGRCPESRCLAQSWEHRAGMCAMTSFSAETVM